MNYYEYDQKKTIVQCSRCGWKGIGAEADNLVQDTFLDVRCPKVECDAPILKLLYPTLDESLAAALAGNQSAKREFVCKAEVFLKFFADRDGSEKEGV